MLGEGDLNEVARNWTPPGELKGSPPRPVRLARTGIFLVIIGAGMVIGGMVLGIKMGDNFARTSENQRLLAEQGTEIDAAVTRLWVGGGKDRPHRVSYRFSANGSVFDAQSTAPRKIWAGLSEGSKLRVRYVASNPSISHPVDWDINTPPKWLFWGLPLIFSADALFMVWMVRRQKRLLEDGRAAPGVITKVSRTKGGLSIRYDFLMPGGVKASGRGKARRGLIDVGSTVTVIYDPDDPKRNAPYPLDLVRPAE